MQDRNRLSLAVRSRPWSLGALGFRLGLAVAWGAAWLIPMGLIAAVLLPWRGLRIRLGNFYAKIVGFPLMWILGIRWMVRHRDRLGARRAIYVCNHTSGLDLFLGSALCPIGGCGVAKMGVIRIPIAGQAYWLAGHLRIDRGSPERAKRSLNGLARVAHRHALSVWLWPEGTRARDGRLQPFKKGFVHIACATGLPVVPVVIVGAHERWSARGVDITPGVVEVEVLAPIETSGWRPETASQHVDEVWRIFRDALPPAQRPVEANGMRAAGEGPRNRGL